MKRFRKIALWTVSLLTAVPIMLLVGVVGVMNTPYARHLIEEKLPSLTSGMVHVEGLSTVLPWHLALKEASLRDQKGVWLTLEKADLRLGLWDLLHKNVRISTLRTSNLTIIRKPLPSTSSPPPSKKKTSLPSLGFYLDELSLASVNIGHDVMGEECSLSISGHAAVPNIAPFMSSLRLDALPTLQATLDVKRRDKNAQAHLDVGLRGNRTDAMVRFSEESGGFVSTLGHMPVLDPVSFQADVHGPTNHLEASVSLQAGKAPSGPLKSMITGTIDLLQQKGDVALRVSSPHMTLRPDMGWESIDLATDLHGSLKSPSGEGHLTVEGLSVAGSGAQTIHTDFHGLTPDGDENKQRLSLTGRIDGLRLPGKASTLFAASPVTLEAAFQPSEKKGRPYALTVNHRLMHLALTGKLSPALTGRASLDIPNLEGLAGLLGGTLLKGSTHLETNFSLPSNSHDSLKAQLTGKMSIVGGQEQATHLIGQNGHLTIQAERWADKSIHVSQISLDGAALHVGGNAALGNDQQLSSSLHIQLPDLKQLQSTLRGKTDLDANVEGALTDLSATLNMDSMLGIQRPGTLIKPSPLSLNAHFDHLPSYPSGAIHAQGAFDSSPVHLDASFQRKKAGDISVNLQQLSWKTIQGQGEVTVPAGQKIPKGDLDIRVSRLEALRPLVGKPISGHLVMGLHTQQEKQTTPKTPSERDVLQFSLEGQAAMAGYAVKHIGIKGLLKHLPDDPYADIRLAIDGIRAQKITGNIQAQITGPQTALALTTKGSFDHLLGAPAHLNVTAVENIPDKTLNLKTLFADVKGERIQLTKPALLSYGTTTGVDHLHVRVSAGHSQPADINIAGRIKPDLNIEASIKQLTPALAVPFMPSLRADGVVEAAASVHGSLSAPVGKVTLDGRGLHMRTDPGASLPPAFFHVQTDLQAKVAQVHAHMEAGHGVLVSVQGVAPLQPDGALGIAAKGKVDLSLANAILGSSGMGTSGQVSLDMNATGTLKQPRLSGGLTVRDGTFDHYAQGVHLTGITGDVIANGDTIHVQKFLIHAGDGTMNLTGDVGALRPGKPVDLQFVMDHAQPLRNDMLEETINSQLHIFGQADSRIDVEGQVKIPQASINIPDSMPASVPQLELVSAKKEKKAPVSSPLVIGLNIDVTSPGKLFVRGHGLFAEMQAKLNVGGTSKAPVITGGVDLRRGNFNLAGISLNFTHGRVGFDGAGVTNKLDPTIDFRADRNANGTLASLLVTGHASAPKIDFTSSPQLSRDEVLALLLFGQSRASLSATQLAELGAAVVQISGGSSFDPLGKVRDTLGLDHLGIGGGGSVENGGTSVEAGKYIMKGVYVGAKEGLSGKGAQAQVRVDLTKNLKLNTTVGTGGQVTGFTTPENDPGSSVGLSYGIDY